MVPFGSSSGMATGTKFPGELSTGSESAAATVLLPAAAWASLSRVDVFW
jgi:hypothetical protein